MCGMVYMIITGTLIFLCAFFTREWITDAHEGLSYPTGFMN